MGKPDASEGGEDGERTMKCGASSPVYSSGGSRSTRNRGLSFHPLVLWQLNVPNAQCSLFAIFHFPKASWGSKATKFLGYVYVSKYVCIHGNV